MKPYSVKLTSPSGGISYLSANGKTSWAKRSSAQRHIDTSVALHGFRLEIEGPDAKPCLETVISQIVSSYPPGTRFDVIAYELWGSRREGYDCNNLWKIARDCEATDVPSHARARWEVYKINYHRRAKVSDIRDVGEGSPFSSLLEVDCIPFLELRPVQD